MKSICRNITCMIIGVLMMIPTMAADKSRGLFAFVNGNQVFVNWRMRATDAPTTTTYKLYADGKLVSTLKDRTNVYLASSYANSTFSLEVVDKNGNIIDSQSGVKADPTYYRNIQVSQPENYTMPDGTLVTHSPYDCSAYDMDGDGEQEIILSWAPSNIGATATATGPTYLDCIKLDGTRLWRINLGPNILGGCRLTFLCYDFDGDGYGELITKTAPGTKDGAGDFLNTGVAKGANHYASSINSSGVITDGGKEWLTCFDGRTGKELATIDYWPYFNIQSDWDDRAANVDGSTYGHRGNWMKGCVATLNVNGKAKPCAVTTRGIYTYSYAAAYTWDGKNLTTLWRNTSDVKGKGIYAQGAHSITCGDVDGDGFDEIIVGAACLDHDGTTLWSSGLGHGDATHLGEFDPDNEGMEYFMITEEETAKYDCALLDAKTGKVLMYKDQSGGDTGRGMALDCDSTYEGAEIIEWSSDQMFDAKGNSIGAWHVGSTTSSSINYRIYWDGDLLDEYFDRGHIDKWDSQNKTWGRQLTLGYNITVDGTNIQWGGNTNNGTKYNPCLQADLVGDWREEVILWTSVNNKYFITMYSSGYESPYKLPWLRDDHVYDMAVAWQNCGYNQTPHLGYSPVDYYKQLRQASTPATLTKHGTGSSSQSVKQGEAIVDFSFEWANAASVKVSGLPNGINADIDTQKKEVRINGTANDEVGEYKYTIETVGNDSDAVKSGTITITGDITLVENAEATPTFTIAPNPMNESTTISFDSDEEIIWSMTDLVGNICRYGKNNGKNFIISRDGLKSGVYILRISTESNLLFEKIIVK